MTTTAIEKPTGAVRPMRAARLRLHGVQPKVVLPLLAIGLVVFVGALGPWLAPIDPYATSLRDAYKPPVWEAGGSWAYPLGADSLGRDVLTRMIYGARVTLLVSLTAIAMGAIVGTGVGLITGFFGGKIDSVLMRVADAAMAFPTIFIGMLLAVTLGASFWAVVAAIALTLWARFARVVRGEVLSLKERDFVALARIAGCSSWRIMFRHLFPNVINTLVVLITLQIGLVIITEASLSFLGAGIPPPSPTWGAMVAEGRNEIGRAWWISAFPGLAILVTSMASNMAGDWIRDTLDPTLRQV